MKYKMLCMDMDGTLLDEEKNISSVNKEAIKKAEEKGIKLVICTGRLFASAFVYADMIGIKTPIIASNGAYIKEKDRDEIIYKSYLTIDECNLILNMIKKYDMYPHFNASRAILTEKIIYSSETYLKYNKQLPKDKQINVEVTDDWQTTFKKYEGDMLKCLVTDEDREKVKKLKEEFINTGIFEVVSSWENNFEVMKKGVSKGRAVEVLAGYYGISRDEIICIGDNENDMSMIEFAGLGVAMGNGTQSLKAAADYVTDTNENNGVAKVIEKFIL